MEDKKKDDRLSIIRNILIVVFVVISVKIMYMAVFKQEHYTLLAENKTYKELPIKASRGEIRDRYGRLLAGNTNSFTVQVSGDGINRKDSKGKSMANNISLDIIKLLDLNGEEYVDEFPIYIKNGKYYYTFDKEIAEYKSSEEIPSHLTAKESFYYLVDKLIGQGILSQEDKRLEASKLQKKLNENNKYPPILVSKWMFTEERDKKDWLKSYGINKDEVSPKKAFKEIREWYEIDPSLSDEEARKILVVRDLIKSQGYSQYNPVTIAKDIKESTISQIEEQAMDLPGVSVEKEPVRHYPNGTLSSHVLGYLGKMNADDEEKLINKANEDGITDGEKKYNKGEFIGKSGVEKYYENQLKGTDGYKKVQVDALGKVTKEIEKVDPKSGDTIYLTIDKDLQEVAESSLKRVIEVASRGGTLESVYGNRSSAGTAPNAKSGALIAIDVKSGETLAMASYPDFDPNIFTKAISAADYEKLQSTNPNDSLAPNSLSNLATHGAFQPGSTFKMITGMSALENGMSPNYTINDPGVIRLGERPFADYIWHKSRSNHGSTNLFKAIQESCNIYFYTIASGKNWTGGANPNAKVGPEQVLKYARLFGLDENTGLENQIGESIGRVPNQEQKLITTQTLLRAELTKIMSNDFTDISKSKNPEEYTSRIEEIVGWASEEKTPGRVEAINRLKKMNIKEDRVEPLADVIVFNYLNFAKWSTADTFNLSIGQGENQYTPAQMSRYIAAIANGGDLVDLSVVGRTVSSDYLSLDAMETKKEKIDFENPESLSYLTEGMKRVSSQGTGKSIFADFPVSVAAKTGTAEKSGKIPTKDEVAYLESHMASYGVSLSEAQELAEKMKEDRDKELSKEREEEIKVAIKDKDTPEDEKKKLEEELKDGVKVKLDRSSNKINAAYLRRAIKELNPRITDEQIDAYKQDYDSFSWSVGFAPANDPEIAVVVVIPQGNESSFTLWPMREVIGKYLGITDELEAQKKAKENKNNETPIIEQNENINFAQSMKK